MYSSGLCSSVTWLWIKLQKLAKFWEIVHISSSSNGWLPPCCFMPCFWQLAMQLTGDWEPLSKRLTFCSTYYKEHFIYTAPAAKCILSWKSWHKILILWTMWFSKQSIVELDCLAVLSYACMKAFVHMSLIWQVCLLEVDLKIDKPMDSAVWRI